MFLSFTCISICFLSVREKDQIPANVPSTGHYPKPGLLCVMACSLSCHVENVVPMGCEGKNGEDCSSRFWFPSLLLVYA